LKVFKTSFPMFYWSIIKLSIWLSTTLLSFKLEKWTHFWYLCLQKMQQFKKIPNLNKFCYLHFWLTIQNLMGHQSQSMKTFGCKHDNMNHTHLLFYCFWGNILKILFEYSWKIFQKIFLNHDNFFNNTLISIVLNFCQILLFNKIKVIKHFLLLLKNIGCKVLLLFFHIFIIWLISNFFTSSHDILWMLLYK